MVKIPKIIKNIEENIFNSALKLFGENGYEKVDMKMISREVGIAVGTLYNYYTNKKDLYSNVFINSWRKTFLKLDCILQNQLNIENKTKLFICTLYDDISERKGLGVELSRVIKDFSDEEMVKINEVREGIHNRIGLILQGCRERDDMYIDNNMKARLIDSILAAITSTIRNYPEQRDENIKFISRLMNFREVFEK